MSTVLIYKSYKQKYARKLPFLIGLRTRGRLAKISSNSALPITKAAR